LTLRRKRSGGRCSTTRPHQANANQVLDKAVQAYTGFLSPARQFINGHEIEEQLDPDVLPQARDRQNNPHCRAHPSPDADKQSSGGFPSENNGAASGRFARSSLSVGCGRSRLSAQGKR
jgi:hypothetical protein